MLNSSIRNTIGMALLAPAFLAIAPSAEATIYVNETFDSYSNGSSILANDPSNWTQSGDSVPGGSSATATVSITTDVSPENSLQLRTTTGESLLRPRFNRDLTDAPVSVGTPMTSATVSFDIHYNYDVALSPSDVSNPKGYAQDTWVYIRNPSNGILGMMRLNGGYYDWYYGVNSYGTGTPGANVRTNAWQHVDVVFDVAGQTATYFLDGIQRRVDNLAGALSGTVGLGYISFENGINTPSGTENSTIFIDNIQLDANIVPEPASLGLLGLGALAIQRRRRRA